MQDALIGKLSFGDLRTTGKVDEVVLEVQQNPALVKDLIECLTHPDPGVRMHAADALEKSTSRHPEWLRSYKNTLLSIFEDAEQQEVLWHLAQIIPRLNLTPNEKLRIFPILKSKYENSKSRIVKTFLLQTFVDLSFESPSVRNEIKMILDDAEKNGSAAMKSRSKKLKKHFN